MKNIIITPSQIKKETIILGICFVVAVGVNIYAISKFNTDWSELLSQLPLVLAITFLLYLLVLLFRLVFLGITRLTQKN